MRNARMRLARDKDMRASVSALRRMNYSSLVVRRPHHNEDSDYSALSIRQ